MQIGKQWDTSVLAITNAPDDVVVCKLAFVADRVGQLELSEYTFLIDLGGRRQGEGGERFLMREAFSDRRHAASKS